MDHHFAVNHIAIGLRMVVMCCWKQNGPALSIHGQRK